MKDSVFLKQDTVGSRHRPDYWEQTFLLGFGAIDPSDRLTLAGAFDYFQEAAINHAELLGIGREAMAQTGQVWILSRMSVSIESRPKYRESLTVRSWPRGWEKLFALREYDIRDATDTAIVRGSSGWLIVDREKRRPLRPQPIIEPLPLNKALPILPGGAIGLESRDNLSKIGERRAVYSDIDFNGHVNNTRYIQWIQDVLDPELFERASRMRLDINYLREIKAGDLAELWAVPLGNTHIALEGRRQEEGQAVFRAELQTFL
ncbi:MAG: acyl-ACP thioesterase [Treponema sp.]|jgi:acyl-ACP thioesterase|nr:acyl-ACP thioesterase [Treponema sp.]